MASSSGNSSGATTTTITSGAGKHRRSSSAEEDSRQLNAPIDERKRKRMESNRESARRSRMKKQKLLDDLQVQVSDLKRDNDQILTAVTVTTEQCLNVEAENSVLRAQMAELTHRLDSLNEMLNCLNSSYSSSATAATVAPAPEMMVMGGDVSHWNLGWMMNNQQLPIMATSVDYHHAFGY